MCKRFKIFSFLILSVLWANSPLQAIGGTEVEEVQDEEIKSKGILKIQYVDQPEYGTGVLFQEGKGWLGLTAKHCFKNFHPLTCPIIAWLGEEKRDIVKVYTPKEQDIDLALFVLSSPFQDGEGFPTLPRSLHITHLYEGYCYGHGYTTSSSHPGPLEGSGKICRKGKLFISTLSKIEPETHRHMTLGNEAHNESDFISFSTLQKNGLVDKPYFKNDADYQFRRLILNRGYIPLKDNNPSDCLLISSSFILPGDSGGPVIGRDNQIYALARYGYPAARGNWAIGLKNAILKEKSYKELCAITILKGEFGVGFVPGEDRGRLYFALNNERSYSSTQIKVLFYNINNMITEDLRNYFLFGESQIFNILLKEEEKLIKMLPTIKPHLSQWLANIHHYNVGYFTSIFSNKDWIEKTMLIAFQDAEEHTK